MKNWKLSLGSFAAIAVINGVASLSFAQTTTGNTSLSFPCTDNHGVKAEWIKTPDPRFGPAASTYMNGQPVIVFNLDFMRQYSTSWDTAGFIVLHECGHLALGHLEMKGSLKKSNEQELAADCFAAQKARQFGLNLNNILKDVNILPRDPEHPSGDVRGKNIVACYNSQPR